MWYEEAVFYHIYPLGMLGAPKVNDYGTVEHRLRELDDWIGHIKEMGFNAIYIGPLFESVGHGYETTDYRKLDSRLGDNEDLKAFVKNCHENGIRVIFDGVFNHTGRDFFAFKDLKANRENSRYRDWFCNVNFYGNNEYNDGFSYDNWGGFNLLVKLNQRNPEVRDYILDVIRFWVSEFDVDGIRLDAADVLDFDFMKSLRALADVVKPEFWLMGEVIHGDYSRWVNDSTLHSVTNYTLHKALYSGHNEHNYFEIAHTIRRLQDMTGGRGLNLYNFTDNHDVERIASKINDRAHLYPVHILEYTLPGVPSVYYGSEFAIEGRKEKYSDDSLRPRLRYEDYKDAINENAFTAFLSLLGRLRLGIKSLSYGDYREVALTNRQYMYTRNTSEYTDIIAVNNDDNPSEVCGSGIRDGEYIEVLSGQTMTVSGGFVKLNVPANYGQIWVMKAEYDKRNVELPKIEKSEIRVESESAVTDAGDVKLADDLYASKEVADRARTESSCEAHSKPCDCAAPVSHEDNNNSVKGVVATDFVNAATKYGLDNKYASLNPEVINNRSDYEDMSIEELQVAILEKMAKNGPVNEQMIKTVMDNVYHDSLCNWVKSFR